MMTFVHKVWDISGNMLFTGQQIPAEYSIKKENTNKKLKDGGVLLAADGELSPNWTYNPVNDDLAFCGDGKKIHVYGRMGGK